MMMKKSSSIIIFIIILFFTAQLYSQKKVFKGDPDVAFKIARDLAFNGKRKEAQDTLRFILTKHATYLDVRSFLASTYSWDGNYKQARKEFATVLNKDPKRKTDWIAAINNELWGEKPFDALELVKKGLSNFKDDPELLRLKAKSTFNLGNEQEAYRTIVAAEKLYPENIKIQDYKNSLNNLLSLNAIGINYAVDIYDKNERDAMHYSTLSYSRQTKYGSITAKLNYSNRFNTNNYQYEVDLYPRIVDGLYAYVSGGVSSSSLFPSVRYGAELYKSLPKSFEASLGFRGLKYNSTTLIYTGSVGWYTGNDYWVFRTYVTPGDAGASKSGSLQYRKYGSDADNYFMVGFGFGVSPELERFIPAGDAQTIFHLDSQKINLGYYFTSNTKNAWGFRANFYREEKPFSKGDYFLYMSLGASYSIRFK